MTLIYWEGSIPSSGGPVSLQLRAPAHPPTPACQDTPLSRAWAFFGFSSTPSLRVRVGLLRLRASNEGLLRPRVARARERTNPQARRLQRALREHEGRLGRQLAYPIRLFFLPQDHLRAAGAAHDRALQRGGQPGVGPITRQANSVSLARIAIHCISRILLDTQFL